MKLLVQRILLLFIIALVCWGNVMAHDVEVDGIYYNLNHDNRTAEVTFKGDMYNQYKDEYKGHITIPANIMSGSTAGIGFYKVNSIGEYAFYDCTELTGITIEMEDLVMKPTNIISRSCNLKTIGKSAFEGCISLESLYIPYSVIYIGEEAFKGCTLKPLTFETISIDDYKCLKGFDGKMIYANLSAHRLIKDYWRYGDIRELDDSDIDIRIGTIYLKGVSFDVIKVRPCSIDSVTVWQYEWDKHKVMRNSFGYYFIDGLMVNSETHITVHRIYKNSWGQTVSGESKKFRTLAPEIGVETIESTRRSFSVKITATEDPTAKVREVGIAYPNTHGGILTYSCKEADEEGIRTEENLIPNKGYYFYPYVKYHGDEDEFISGKIFWGYTKSIVNNLGLVVTSTCININPEFQLFGTEIQDCWYEFENNKYKNSHFHIQSLEPEGDYNISLKIKSSDGYLEIIEEEIKTNPIEINALKAKATSNTKAIICAQTNICDEERGIGFEWRRIDAPDLVPSEEVYSAVHDGVMEGILNNLSPNTYYKYRPFYKSAKGNMYYGEWIGFGTADAYVYFTPTVHTYETATVTNNSVTLGGYALGGSDDVMEQGFEYWIDGATTRTSGNVMTAVATGQRMSVTLTDLLYNTTYKYRAYVKTAKETMYGEELTFTTGEDPNGIIEHVVTVRPLEENTTIYNLQGIEMKDKNNLPKGIYIRGGKKFIVK